MEASTQAEEASEAERVATLLGERNVILVGMMGAGKTSIGRRLAHMLHIPFVDADAEIERAANLSIPEIFDHYGEAHFRDGEQRVIARILSDGPKVLATGGGAFMADATRTLCAETGVTIWLRADVPVLLERVRKKTNRPLLNQPDPERVLKDLLTVREPVYATADISVESRDVPQNVVVGEILTALAAHLEKEETV